MMARRANPGARILAFFVADVEFDRHVPLATA